VTGGFVATFGHEPDGVWAAPGRVNIIGEFTDYNDGFVLPMALDAVTRAAVSRRGDDVVVVASSSQPSDADPVVSARLGDLAPGEGRGWSDYVLGVAWAIAESGHDLGGVEVFVDSEVPIGAGLSSSAALECSFGLALRDLFAPELSLGELAQLTKRAENEFVGVPSGIMDQTASLLCRAGHAMLLDTRSGAIDQLGFDLAGAGLALLVIDTSVRRQLAHSAYADRRRACEAAAAAIGVPALRDATLSDLARVPDEVARRRARHVITEDARVLAAAQLLRSGDLAAVGPLLSASHRSLRVDFEVSCAELDLAVETALAEGALGARMIGGGFGGCVIALVGAAQAPSVAEAVRRAFAGAGFLAPVVFAATPAAGAHRLA